MSSAGDKLGDKRTVCILPLLQHGVLINEPVCLKGLIPTAQNFSAVKSETNSLENQVREGKL